MFVLKYLYGEIKVTPPEKQLINLKWKIKLWNLDSTSPFKKNHRLVSVNWTEREKSCLEDIIGIVIFIYFNFFFLYAAGPD